MLFPEIVIAGCGNPLFADDGFGPAVIEEMQNLSLPDNVVIVDAGLGGPHFIFTLVDPEVTKKLIIICAADFGVEPGTLRKLKVGDLPPGAFRDAHSFDNPEPLQRIKDQIDITIVGCQIAKVTQPEFYVGLSDELERVIPKTIRLILEMISVD